MKCDSKIISIRTRNDFHVADIICERGHHNGFTGNINETPRKNTTQKNSRKELSKLGLWFCWFCGRLKEELNHNETVEGDHILPLNKGGEDSPENIQPLCSTCHKLKNWMQIHVVNKTMKKRGYEQNEEFATTT